MRDISIGSDGSLSEPPLHDARLYRIDFGGKEVGIYFQDPSARRYRLIFRGVAQMFSQGLAEGNIVLDAVTYDERAVLSQTMNRFLPSNTRAQKEYSDALVQRLMARELMLIHITPSYGGEVVIICSAVQYEMC